MNRNYILLTIFENLDGFKITHLNQKVNPIFQAPSLVTHPTETKKAGGADNLKVVCVASHLQQQEVLFCDTF